MLLRRSLRALCLTLAVAAAACSSDGGGARATPQPSATSVPALTAEEAAVGGPYGVGVLTVELVDTSRPTAPNREFAGSPERTLVTEIWYPAAPTSAQAEERDAPADLSGGPYPLIIFAHGFSAFRRQSASYAQQLASHGYVVASPDFPGSNIAALGGPRIYAVLDQPADVSFVIDELLARGGKAGWPLDGAIDPETIGMTGHSLGGLTTMLTAYGERRDPRIDAILPISPVGCFLPEGFAGGVSLPVMVVGGSRELIVPPPWIRQAYDIASPPKYFVSIIGADHIRFADLDTTDDAFPGIVDSVSGGTVVEDSTKIIQALGSDGARCLQREASMADELITGDRQREILRTVALPFFDAYLKRDKAALRFLQDTLPTLPDIRFDSDTGEQR
jgi:predicted dienelactone hydrolase